jgi:hypothetical protein
MFFECFMQYNSIINIKSYEKKLKLCKMKYLFKKLAELTNFSNNQKMIS